PGLDRVGRVGPALALSWSVKIVRTGVLALAVLLTVGGAAETREQSGVQVPDRVQTHGHTLILNGTGVREATWMKVNVYVAARELEHGSSSPADILRSRELKRLDLVFVRGVGRDDIVKAFREGFQASAGPRAEQLQPRVNTLLGWMAPMKRGDS